MFTNMPKTVNTTIIGCVVISFVFYLVDKYMRQKKCFYSVLIIYLLV